MRRLFLVVLLGIAVWIGFDLLAPRRVDMRQFDPETVARLDTEMWRSYYDRKPMQLYFQLAELLREQFHFPIARSHLVAASAAKAAFLFKRGENQADYQKALPDLERYYTAIQEVSTTPFDVPKTAQLELEWWIVHRQRNNRTPEELENALAFAAAALYRVPPVTLLEYARERTVAMSIRDSAAQAGGVSERDWMNIEDHLRIAWRSLKTAVQPSIARSAR